MLKPHHITRYAAPAIGIALFLAGILEDGRIDRTDVRATGLLLTLLAVIAAARSSRSAATGGERSGAAYELGYREGHEQGKKAGYDEGRKVARPVVVPLMRASADAAAQMQRTGPAGTA